MGKSKKTRRNNLAVTLPSGNRLVALPVAGDAFLLVRNDDAVLVDGGKNGKRLHKSLLSELPQPLAIRRIICTHNDADHAEGLAEMLEDFGRYKLKVDEVWLPGSWADPAAKMAEGQVTILMSELLKDSLTAREYIKVNSSERHLTARNLAEPECETFLKVLAGSRQTNKKTAEQGSRDDVTDSIVPKSEICKKLRACDFRSVQKVVRKEKLAITKYLRWYGRNRRPLGAYGSRAVGTSYVVQQFQLRIKSLECIFRIAVGAAKRGAKLRWFDAESYYRQPEPRQSQGGDDDLVPLNSIELDYITPAKEGIGELLFLTQVNLHSLIFWAPEADLPGCVFSADGILDGDAPNTIPLRPIVVTAPHHGSESNVAAYPEISRMIGGVTWLKDTILLRSDVKAKKNPCAEFKKTKNRLCTVCPNSSLGYKKVSICVDPLSSTWNFSASAAARDCTCK